MVTNIAIVATNVTYRFVIFVGGVFARWCALFLSRFVDFEQANDLFLLQSIQTFQYRLFVDLNSFVYHVSRQYWLYGTHRELISQIGFSS